MKKAHNSSFAGHSWQAVFVLLFLLFSLQVQAQKKKGTDPLKDLTSAIDASYETFKPTGLAVAVVKDGEIVLKKAYGSRNVNSEKSVDTQSLFNIASCSKAFTAACIGLLVEEGKLKWDDKVVDYLPGFQLADPWISSQLTVRDLLCHRSGLGTFYGDLLWYGTNYSDEEIMHRMRFLPMTNAFRSEFGYQNNMYMVAGLIIKKVTGKTWSEFVSERLFKPLDMNNTYPSNDELPTAPNLAQGHIDGQLLGMHDFNGTKPAASIYSNVEDLSNWTRMLLDGGKWNGKQVLAEATIKEVLTPQINVYLSPAWESWGVNFKSYGLGWALFDYAGKKVAEHNGGMPGYISKVTILPSEKLSIIVLNSGMDGVVNDAIRFKILDYYLKQGGRDWDGVFKGYAEMGRNHQKAETEKRLAARVPDTKPSLPLSAYVGTYTDKMYGDATIEIQGEALYFTMLPTRNWFAGLMEHFHYDSFKVTFKDKSLPFAIVSFELGPKAEVKGFKIDLPNGDFHFFNLNFKRKP